MSLMRMSWTWGLPLEGTSSSFFPAWGITAFVWTTAKLSGTQNGLWFHLSIKMLQLRRPCYTKAISPSEILEVCSKHWSTRKNYAKISVASPLWLYLAIKEAFNWAVFSFQATPFSKNSGLILTQPEKPYSLPRMQSGWLHKKQSHMPRDVICWYTTEREKETNDTTCCLYKSTRRVLKAHHSPSRTNTGTENDRTVDGFLFHH